MKKLYIIVLLSVFIVLSFLLSKKNDELKKMNTKSNILITILRERLLTQIDYSINYKIPEEYQFDLASSDDEKFILKRKPTLFYILRYLIVLLVILK